MNGETQHALSPTVLRERAERLESIGEWFQGMCRIQHGDTGGTSNCGLLDSADDAYASAADLRLLADLLDAFGDPANLRHLGAAFDLPYLTRIAEVLEAHRD